MPWLPDELVPAFMRRLVGDEDGWGEFRATWITAVNMWFKRMAEPYRTLELFNAFVGAGFKYEELFPQPPPKPEAQKPAERPAVEVQRPEERGLRREVVEKPTVKPEAAGCHSCGGSWSWLKTGGCREVRRRGGAVMLEVVKPEGARTEVARLRLGRLRGQPRRFKDLWLRNVV